MRVLQLGMSGNRGGVESFVLNYAKGLEAMGISFDYVDLYGKGLAGADDMLRAGSRIYTVADHRKHPLAAFRKLRRIISEGGYSCVHINMLSAADPIPVLAAVSTGARVLVHSHNTRTVGLHRKLLHAVNTPLLRRLPIVRLACSREAGIWMFGKKNFEFVPNALEAEKYCFNAENRTRLRTELGIDESVFLLGFVGRLFAQKNPAYLAKILSAVKNKNALPVKLLIVGDGELKDALFEAASDLGVSQDIIHVGHRSDAAEWYSAMDAFVLPSLWEGLPLVGVEAQAAGLPSFLSAQITDELAVTDLVYFCKLTEDAENWADAIVSNRRHIGERPGYAAELEQSRFALANSSKLLYELYCGGEKVGDSVE